MTLDKIRNTNIIVSMKCKLRIKCKEAGLTQKELAQKTGVQQPQICKIENGVNKPDIKTAKRIAKVLGFDWTEFYREEDEDDISGSS